MVLGSHKNLHSDSCLQGMLGATAKLSIGHVCDPRTQRAKCCEFKANLGCYLKKREKKKQKRLYVCLHYLLTAINRYSDSLGFGVCTHSLVPLLRRLRQ